MLLFCAPSSAQYISALSNYALNATGHDIVRDIGVTEDYTKITVGSYQPSGSSAYNGFIWSDQTDNTLDWRVIVGGTGNDEVNAVDVRRVWNGTEYVEDIYVTGYFTGTATFTRYIWYPFTNNTVILTMNSPYGANDCTYFVAKLNQYGNVVWIQYSGNNAESNTEIGNDVDVCVVGSEVQVYTTGFFRGNPYFYQGDTPTTLVNSATSWNSIFTTKYVDNGNTATLAWVRTVNDNTNNQHDYGYGVCGDGSGNVFMCGSIGNTATVGSFTLTVEGNDDAVVAQYNSSGTIQWIKDIGGSGTLQTPSDQARCITYSGGNVFVSGYVCGYSSDFPQTNNSSVDAFLMRMNATTGTYGWRNILQNQTGADVGYKHCLTPDGSTIFAVGQMTGDLSIYCSSITASGSVYSENGGAFANGFFTSFQTSNGALIDHESVYGYDNTCTMTTVEAYTDCEIHFGGVFKDYTIYESGNNYTANNSNPTVNYITFYNDGFYGSYACNPFRLAAPADESEEPTGHGMKLDAFPNPTNNSVTISKNSDAEAWLEVLDVTGRNVIEATLVNTVQTTVDMSSLDPGIYIVRVTEGNTSEVIRVTKK